jgi:uncharacterized protein (DUF1778 family)
LNQRYDVRLVVLCVPGDLSFALTDDERQLDNVVAMVVGEALSDFFRRAAGVRAREVRADQRQMLLSEDEAMRFLDVLDAVDQNKVTRLRELRASCPPKLSPQQ